MPVVYDKILGKIRDGGIKIPSYSSDPSSAAEGTIILNTTDHKIKVYYSSSWQDLHTLTASTPLQGNPIGLLLVLTYANDQ